mgnify:CR=1 FL=1
MRSGRAKVPLRLAYLAQLRQAVYRFLGALFLYPEERRRRQLIEAARTLRREEETFASFPFFSSWQRLLSILTSEEVDGGTLEEEYVRLFVAGPGGPLLPPYESSYRDPDRMTAGWIPLSLEREYAAAGLTLSPALHEPPDHISVELEYMAFLCGREAEAWEQRDQGEGRKILEQESTFMDRHLSRWVPEFARNLKAHQDGLYGAAGEAVAAYVHHDLDLVTLLLEYLCEGGP